MKVLQLSFDLEPIEGVDKLQVMYYGDNKGWFIHFWMGKDAMGNPHQYTIFNGFVIYGGFGLLNVMKKLKKEDYLYRDIDGRDAGKVIDAISKMTIDEYKEHVKYAMHDYPTFILRKEDLENLEKGK